MSLNSVSLTIHQINGKREFNLKQSKLKSLWLACCYIKITYFFFANASLSKSNQTDYVVHKIAIYYFPNCSFSLFSLIFIFDTSSFYMLHPIIRIANISHRLFSLCVAVCCICIKLANKFDYHYLNWKGDQLKELT